MKNWLFALACCLFLQTTVSAQLMIKNDGKQLYLEHPVAPKEGLYSVARLYNVHPKHLASFNSLDANAGLNIGQVLRIPLSDTNFTQSSNKGTPLHYRVGEKEGLMAVSNANGKVKLQSLREWNKLKNDKLRPGSNIIVGFLTTQVAAPVAVKEDAKGHAEEKIVKTEPPKEKVVAKVEPAVKTSGGENGVAPAAVTPTAETRKPSTENTKTPSPAGYFKQHFDEQVKQAPLSKLETVTGGIFKTSFGLQEAKYYLLLDAVTPGTIVRVINPENNRAIYAKVLGEMNGIRQNKGLGTRISESAAISLGITDTEKFIVQLNY